MLRRTLMLLPLALTGCAAPVKYNTASGRPERTFDASPDRVRAALVGHLVNRGYQITNESASRVVGQKRTDNAMAQVLLGTNYDRNVEVRATFTIIPEGPRTRVVGDLALVSNPGSAFERVTPMSNSQDSIPMQQALDSLSV